MEHDNNNIINKLHNYGRLFLQGQGPSSRALGVNPKGDGLIKKLPTYMRKQPLSGFCTTGLLCTNFFELLLLEK